MMQDLTAAAAERTKVRASGAENWWPCRPVAFAAADAASVAGFAVVDERSEGVATACLDAVVVGWHAGHMATDGGPGS